MDSFAEIAVESPIFRDVPREKVEGLMRMSVVRPADRGASIFLQGERAHSLFITLDGWVKTYRMSTFGSEAIVGIFTKGGFFGEEAALHGSSYMAGAEAVSEALLLQLDGAVIAHALNEDVALCKALLSGALEQNRSLVCHVEQLKSHTAAQRIADFLISLCGSRSRACTVVLPYDKVLIAGWLGMKPESLSRAFRRLKDYGVTIKKNHAVIESVEALCQYAEEDPAEAWSAQS